MALGYVIVLHLFVLALIVKTDFIPKVKVKLGVAASFPNPHIPNMLRYHQWMDESVPEGATIFLGDSITQGLATAAIAPFSINYGIGSENTAQLIDALPIYKSLSRANAIVLAIGINDLGQGMKVGLNDRYQKVLESLPADVPLIWNAVMPVKLEDIALADIAATNKVIQTLCEKKVNCAYVDTWQFLSDKNGHVISDFFLDDGVHLSPKGYSAWIAELRQTMKVVRADAQPIIPPDLAHKAAQGR
ncbi:MAG: hypothetical protein K9L60_13660 [Methylovulum sp.]|nr:hypothetical protein [Methylovulum sp.]MCF8000204.1 hypothetical protein [Methylovulum sp.]